MVLSTNSPFTVSPWSLTRKMVPRKSGLKFLVFSVMPNQNENRNCSMAYVQNLGKDKEGKYSETLTKIQVTAVFFLTEKTKNFSVLKKLLKTKKSCSKYKMLPKSCRNQEARGI